MVSFCPICLEFRNSNPNEPLVPHDIPDYPWQNVATDLFTLNGQDYIVVVNIFSRYFEFEKLGSTSSDAVIRKVKGIYSRHGIPEKVVSDNDPQYASHECDTVAEQWEFTHVTSNPRNSQSNGLTVKTVQTIKRILIKANKSKSDPYIGLLEYRTTLLSDTGFSPSQLLMIRGL